jgi:rhamnosyltransferase
MKVTVIIPTFNGEKELLALLPALKQQSIMFELLIIDSSSSDGTGELAKEYADRYIQIPAASFDHGGTRTLAAKEASGEILVFLTQDAIPASENTIETLVNRLSSPHIAAAYGRQLPLAGTSLFGTHLRLFNYPPKASYLRTFEDKERYGIKTAFLSDSFAVYRKSALEQIGWFKNGLILGEDMYAAAKLLMEGYTVAYCADAEVYHAHSYTLLEEFKRYFDTGVFHSKESWLLETFGKTDGEGLRYIRSELRYLLARKAYLKLPEFIVRNGMKFVGYKIGRHFDSLPKGLIRHLSMHPSWWDRSSATD